MPELATPSSAQLDDEHEHELHELPYKLEAAPAHLRATDRPVYGGTLFFHQSSGLAGCPRCGWHGVATLRNGVSSSYCPACTGSHAAEQLVDAARRRMHLHEQRRHFDVPRVPRNALCPCGSGVKAKRCDCEQFSC